MASPGRMGEATRWQRRVEGFVLDQIGDPPARVLEVGSGKGDLAVTLARAGYSVTAIDPGAPEGPIFRRVGIEEFSEPGPFDHVVAILSLHHIEDIGGALDKIAGLIRAGGTLIVVEFAWDRIDVTTARWALARLPGTPGCSGKHSWLERCCRGTTHDGGDEVGHLHTEARGAVWAGEAGLHSSGRILEEIGRRFAQRYFSWWPYLYPDLDDTSEADELVAIEAGEIKATSFCYVGTVAPEKSAFAR